MNKSRTAVSAATVRPSLVESTRAAAQRLGPIGRFALIGGSTATAWVTIHSGPPLIATAYGIALAAILLAAAIDAVEQRLPNVLTIGGTVFTLGIVAAATILGVHDGWWRVAAGGVIFGGWILASTLLVPGAYGLGDVKLAVLCGILLAWQSWPTFVLGILATQIVIAATLLVARGRKRTRAPLGPSFTAGALAALVLATV